MNARGAVVQSVTLSLACLASYSLVRYASAHFDSLSHADDLVGGLWAVIATAFVFRTTEGESITAVKTRVAATGLSFALCLAFLLFLPSHPWGMALMIAVSTLLLIALGQSGDVGVSAITIGAVMVIAALGPHDPWKQPLIGAVATAVGIAIGFAASWFANVRLVVSVRRPDLAHAAGSDCVRHRRDADRRDGVDYRRSVRNVRLLRRSNLRWAMSAMRWALAQLSNSRPCW